MFTGPFVGAHGAEGAAKVADRASRAILHELLDGFGLPIEGGDRSAPQVLFESLAFGRQPLAISARCYHARLHKLAKDNCRFVCENDPDGLAVDTLDGEPFLAINGVQTLSFTCANLVADIPALSAAGLRALRLSPQVCDMAAVARVFRDVLDGRREAGSGLEALGAIYPKATFANGFLHGEAGARRIGPARPA